jgi:SAM-dependent methyltransferase
LKVDPATYREQSAEHWELAASGWGRRADLIRDMGMPVSTWMIEHAQLQPGQRLLELAAGPGDTGFLAAELIKPGGTLICSDMSEGMLELARERAAAFGVDNVEFKRLELEWIDLETASVDVVLCRWGIMLVADPAAAVTEVRRVVAPGGRLAVAVWDAPGANPWATIPGRTMIDLGHSEPPEPDAPGMFALAEPGRLQELLESAGFTDVVVEPVEVDRDHDDVDAYMRETLDLSKLFADAFAALSEPEQVAVRNEIAARLEPYADAQGALHLPGRSLAAAANA